MGARGAQDAGGTGPGGAPVYVQRDADEDLREGLAAGGFVPVIGDSAAGKSRTAFEAARAVLSGHVLVRPQGRDGVSAAAARAARERRCVLWLDDLERYLGPGGLTAAQAGGLVAGAGHHRVIVSTIRAAELERLTARAETGDEAGRQAASDLRQVLDLARQVRISRLFSALELERARTRAWDPRIADALERTGSYGIAEYLSAGPELLRAWQDARDSSAGMHAQGAALVAAAIDIRRAGWTSALPRDLLGQASDHYLAGPGHAHVPREELGPAWEWATRPREATAALLRPVPGSPGVVEVFDYLVDAVQRAVGPLDSVPEPVITAAISFAGAADADALADVAYAQGRFALAERGWRRACQAGANDPDLGAEHPGTLSSRCNLAIVLRPLGRHAEAEAEQRAVLEARTRLDVG